MGTRRLAKLTRPRSDGMVPRERLFGCLDALHDLPLVWLSAPPGAGKTSLASSWIESRGIPCIWYQLDAGDADPGAFFHHLDAAAASLAAGAPVRLPVFGPDAAGDPGGFARVFFRELFASAPESLRLVLDDFHELPDDHAVARVVCEAARQAVEGIQVVVLSRLDPPAAFAPMRAARRLGLLGWPELQLRPEETASLARAFNAPAHLDTGALHARTEGWAAGLALLVEGERRRRDMPAIPAGEGMQVVFDYFAAVLLDHAPAATRQQLLDLAALPRMTPGTVQALTGDAATVGFLEELARRNLFTVRRPGAEPVYEFHALFRTFLRSTARREMPVERYEALRARAARLLEHSGQVPEALDLFCEGGDWDRFRSLFCRIAPEYMAQGRRDSLRAWVGLVPLARLVADPWLVYWGTVTDPAIAPGLSLDRMRRAWEGFQREGDREGMLRAAAHAADVFGRGRQDWHGVDAWIDRLETLLAGHQPHEDEPTGRAFASLMRAQLFRCPHRPCTRALARELQAGLEDIVDADVLLDIGLSLLAFAWWHGESAAAERLVTSLSRVATSALAGPRVRATWYWWQGVHFTSLLRHDLAAEALDRGGAVADDSGLSPLRPEFDRLRLVHHVQRGEHAAAMRMLEACVAPFLEEGSMQLRAGHCMHVAQAALGLGQARTALEFARRGALEQESAGHVFNSSVLTTVHGCALIQAGHPAEAEAVFEAMIERLGEHGSRWLRGACQVGMAHARLRTGDAAGARAALCTGLPALADSDYFWGAGWFSLYDPYLLAEALRGGIETGYAGRVIRQRGIGCPDPDLEAWPWPVRVRALGGWQLECAGLPPEAGGGRRRSRQSDLLRLLVAHGPEPMDMRRVADMLWADSEGDAAINALGVAVHRVRRSLGDEHAVAVAGGTVCLDPRRCWVDAWAFDRCIERLRALDCGDAAFASTARRALSLYRGRLLERDADAPWMLSPRERRHRDWLWMVRTAGQACEATGDLDAAVALYEQALRTDPLNESLYCLLMTVQARQGAHADAIDTYRRAASAGERGVPPEMERLMGQLRAGRV